MLASASKRCNDNSCLAKRVDAAIASATILTAKSDYVFNLFKLSCSDSDPASVDSVSGGHIEGPNADTARVDNGSGDG